MIQYICDNCQDEVYEPEAVGPGVLLPYDDHPHLGKAYVFEDSDSDLTLTVSVGSRNGNHQHFCLACMWKMVRKMLRDKGPVETPEDVLADYGVKDVVDPFPETVPNTPNDLAKRFMEQEEARQRAIRDKYEVSNDQEVDPPTAGTDRELSELHASGVLPETGPHVPSLYPRPQRPGWTHPRQVGLGKGLRDLP